MGANNAQEQAAEERRAKAWELRVRGKTITAISKELGVSVSTAHKYIKQAVESFREDTRELVEQHRKAQLQRLDIAIERLMPMVDGADDKLSLDAMDRLDKLERRRSQLLGLDEPEKHSHAVSASVKATPAAAASLVREKFGSLKQNEGDGEGPEAAPSQDG